MWTIYRVNITSANPKCTDYLLLEVRSAKIFTWNNKVSSESFHTPFEDFVTFSFLASFFLFREMQLFFAEGLNATKCLYEEGEGRRLLHALRLFQKQRRLRQTSTKSYPSQNLLN